MRGLARISFPRGALLLPTRTPYDRDVVCEHVDAYARQHGTVSVEVGRKSLTVRYTDDGTHESCSDCERVLDSAVRALNGRVLCVRCALAER